MSQWESSQNIKSGRASTLKGRSFYNTHNTFFSQTSGFVCRNSSWQKKIQDALREKGKKATTALPPVWFNVQDILHPGSLMRSFQSLRWNHHYHYISILWYDDKKKKSTKKKQWCRRTSNRSRLCCVITLSSSTAHDLCIIIEDSSMDVFTAI